MEIRTPLRNKKDQNQYMDPSILTSSFTIWPDMARHLTTSIHIDRVP